MSQILSELSTRRASLTDKGSDSILMVASGIMECEWSAKKVRAECEAGAKKGAFVSS